ncbi:MAG: DUF1049 domain-containing protein [Rhodobacterales bacterium]|nr:MAG: DUF1049 domain-containing protein [Rhodobacterales bacterium]
MRYLRIVFLAVVAVGLVTVALANRGPVTLHLLPEALAGFAGLSWQITVPLFLVIFAGIIAGILIGFIWEYFREHKLRAEGKRARKAAVNLAREVQDLKTSAKPGDDVLALLEDAR